MLSLAISTLCELLSIVGYAFYFPKLPIVKYYRSKAASEGATTVAADLAVAGIQTNQQVIYWNLTISFYASSVLNLYLYSLSSICFLTGILRDFELCV